MLWHSVRVWLRQISEPLDPVFYVDGMESAATNGAALETAIMEGQEHNVRYYSEVRMHTGTGGVRVHWLRFVSLSRSCGNTTHLVVTTTR